MPLTRLWIVCQRGAKPYNAGSITWSDGRCNAGVPAPWVGGLGSEGCTRSLGRHVRTGQGIDSHGSALLADCGPQHPHRRNQVLCEQRSRQCELQGDGDGRVRPLAYVEQWFERAKQEAGFSAFEVRTYTSLIRHWLCSRMAMYFLAAQTQRLRGEKSADHTGAGCGRGQCVGLEDMEPLAAFVA